ncbi:DUF2851 family protein [Ginsengibacter hankyongi]|uniref:DUF2851 family protein n=1 Tax=Ginsengibacter hankyongi TaxID=2607284 RepID=A0A5J5IF09_9BACT|nr:DUF2851 family protein [Ginsengibacter hankyongi]KAA9038432.1 DUF2851 family protein [Ginsengibacter hankyongi]
MKEDLLQYIWQFQYFNNSELVTSSGEPIQVIKTGNYNTNQGADFIDAKIKIGKTTWAGNVELHLNSSDWNVHNHSADSNFNNVILHVVWNNNVLIKDKHGNNLATVELKNRVPKLLLEKYRMLMDSSHFIPCENQLPEVNELTLSNWKQRLVAERLIEKSKNTLAILKETNFHWEETFWWLIAANFGIKVNSDLFQKVARSIPVSILAKHKNSIPQVEALLFGTAGLLVSEFIEKYPLMLKKEFSFYQKKYNLKAVDGELSFLRMRPANFPTIRLAQLAMLIHESEHLFSKIKDATSLKEIKKMLDVSANDYWHYHYIFDETSGYKVKTIGKQMIDNIIINTIIPTLFAYGLNHNEEVYKDKAIKWLEEIAAEKNNITKAFEKLNFLNKNALDSQALIQLKNEYCNKKLCPHCAIGNTLLKRNK